MDVPMFCKSLPTLSIVLLQAEIINPVTPTIASLEIKERRKFHVDCLYEILRTSTKWPSIAAAAAIAGLTKWVRPPLP